MRRIMLTVAYDGTDYNGWQIQPSAPTIEGVLDAELSRILGENIRVIGASRTDAGVHAEGAIAVFDTESSIPGDKFSYALNQSLPEDIVIRQSREVAPDFHPRKVSCRKTYRYSIWHDEFALPTNSRYTHWIHYPLDIDAMKKAAPHFIGEHDFAAFCSAAADVETTVIMAYDCWKEKKNYGKVSMGVVRTTYLIDENGVIVRAMDKVKAADNPAQMLELL